MKYSPLDAFVGRLQKGTIAGALIAFSFLGHVLLGWGHFHSCMGTCFTRSYSLCVGAPPNAIYVNAHNIYYVK